MALGQRAKSEREAREGRAVEAVPLNRGKTFFLALVFSLLLAALVAWLFYDSPWALLLAFPFFLRLLPYLRCRQKRKREQLFRRHFQEYLRSLVAGLHAGYAAENAFLSADREIAAMTGEESELCQASHRLCARLHLQLPLEQGLRQMQEEIPFEEIEQLAELIAFAKRLGGDYGHFIERSAQSLGERLRLAQELEAELAAKKYEQKIMSAMPLFVLIYLRLVARGYLDPIYHNPLGIGIASFCLCLYLLMIFWGERLVEQVMQV